MIQDYLLSTFWENSWARPFYPILQYIYTKVNPTIRSIFHSRVQVKAEPIYILLSSTYCNAKCIFCPYRFGTHKFDMMSIDTFNKALEQLKEVKTTNICLSPTVGEALLNPNIFYFIEELKKNGMLSYIYSNGVALLTNNNYKKLVDTGINEIHISLSDLNPQLESQVYGITLKQATDKIDGILKLIDYNDKVKKVNTIRLEFRSQRNPCDVLNEPIFEYIKGKCQYVFALGYDNWGGTISQDDLLGSMKMTTSIDKINVPCDKLKNTSILPDGTVRLCGCRFKKTLNDDLVIGNIHNNTLKELSKSKQYKAIFKRFENGEYPEVCKQCSFYQPDSKGL